MPTYEYRCKECGYEFEVFHKMSDRIDCCPKCSGKVNKLIGIGAGVIVRGTENPCHPIPGVKKIGPAK